MRAAIVTLGFLGLAVGLLGLLRESSHHAPVAPSLHGNIEPDVERGAAVPHAPTAPATRLEGPRRQVRAQPPAARSARVTRAFDTGPAAPLPAGDDELDEQLRQGHSLPVAFAKLMALWETETVSVESTNNGLMIADSFLTEVGLAPESVEHLECRATLCSAQLKADLPSDQLLAVKHELEQSGIPVSADFSFGEDGQFRVTRAFFPRSGHEQDMVVPAPSALAAGGGPQPAEGR